MKTVDIICPLYNAEAYIQKLNISLEAEKNINKTIRYILTESSDKTEDFLIQNHLNYQKVKKEEFSHSLTREKAVMESCADYVLFMSQDVEIVDEDTIHKLVEFASENQLAGAYIRQKSIYALDKYFREISYPKENHIYSKKDLLEKGRDAIFFSDAFSLIDVELFKRVNGYDSKNLNTNEDMYYSYKMLSMDYKMGYLGDAYVLHSHKQRIKSTYKRYKEIGWFLEENKEINQLKGEGGKYLKIIGLMLKHFAIASMIMLPLNGMARILGMKKGRRLYHKNK